MKRYFKVLMVAALLLGCLGYGNAEDTFITLTDADDDLLIFDTKWEWPEYFHENPVASYWQDWESETVHVPQWIDICIQSKCKVYLYGTDKDVIYVYRGKEFSTLYRVAHYIARRRR